MKPLTETRPIFDTPELHALMGHSKKLQYQIKGVCVALYQVLVGNDRLEILAMQDLLTQLKTEIQITEQRLMDLLQLLEEEI